MAKETQIHLFRGAPCVRGWSKYQETVQEWTLCGIPRMPNARVRKPAIASEDPQTVNCSSCLELMKPTKAELARGRKRFVA